MPDANKYINTIEEPACAKVLGVLPDLTPEFQFHTQELFDVRVVSLDSQQQLGFARPITPKVERVEIGDSKDVLRLAVVIIWDGTRF